MKNLHIKIILSGLVCSFFAMNTVLADESCMIDCKTVEKSWKFLTGSKENYYGATITDGKRCCKIRLIAATGLEGYSCHYVGDTVPCNTDVSSPCYRDTFDEKDWDFENDNVIRLKTDKNICCKSEGRKATKKSGIWLVSKPKQIKCPRQKDVVTGNCPRGVEYPAREWDFRSENPNGAVILKKKTANICCQVYQKCGVDNCKACYNPWWCNCTTCKYQTMEAHQVECPPDDHVEPVGQCPRTSEYTQRDWIPVKSSGELKYILRSKQNQNLCCEIERKHQNTPGPDFDIWWNWYPQHQYTPYNAHVVNCPNDDNRPNPKGEKGWCQGECNNVCFEKYDGDKDTQSYRIYFKYNSDSEPNTGCNKKEWENNIKSIYTDNADKEIDRIIMVGGASCEGPEVVKKRVDFVHNTLQSVAPADEINKLTDCQEGENNPNCSQYAAGTTKNGLGYQFDPETEACKYRVVFVHVTFKRQSLKTLINSVINTRNIMADNSSVWKTASGNFNGSRLASDSIAGVVLGTAGGLITSNVVKKNQVSSGLKNVICTVGGQSVAEFDDEFTLGIQ